jgi:hypothetical protein
MHAEWSSILAACPPFFVTFLSDAFLLSRGICLVPVCRLCSYMHGFPLLPASLKYFLCHVWHCLFGVSLMPSCFSECFVIPELSCLAPCPLGLSCLFALSNACVMHSLAFQLSLSYCLMPVCFYVSFLSPRGIISCCSSSNLFAACRSVLLMSVC